MDKESRNSQSESDTAFENKTTISDNPNNSVSSEGDGGLKFDDQNDTDEDIEEDENSVKEGGNPKNTRATMREGGTLIFTRNRALVEKEVEL